MKKNLFTFLLPAFLVLPTAAFCQDFTRDYTPLMSAGKLPDDFIQSASLKAMQEVEKLKKKGDKNLRDKKKFIISNAFFLDNVLKSGKVLYGDPIGKYISRVADEVLKNDKSTREKLRFYVVKSPVVNAFAFDNGIILFTTGFISQLENEAQLAFAIGHEVVHFKKKHNINAHLEFIGMDKKRRSFNKNGTNLLLEKSKFNKKQEQQADDEGFKMFEATNYTFKSIDGLFDVLQYSYLPFEDTEFDQNWFNDQNLIIPKSYYREKVKDIHSDDDYNDSLSTHPNIRKRREKIEEEIQGRDDKGRKDFIVSEADFNLARELSRFETCRMYMQDLDYPEAIYSAYVLLKKFPNNIYLKKIIARSLYQVAVYKSMYERYTYTWEYKNGTINYFKKKAKSRVERIIDYVDSIQGSSQQVYSLLNKMSPIEVTVLALNNNWKLYQTLNYNDPYTSEICDSLMNMLAFKHKTKMEDFSQTKKPAAPVVDSAAIKAAEAKDKKALSKYDKIRKKSKSKISEDSFCKYAFVDLAADKKFTDKLASTYKAAKKEKKPAETASKTKSGSKTVKTSKTTASKTKTKPKKGDEEEESGDSDEEAEEDSVKIDIKEVESMKKESNATSITEYKFLGIDRVVIVDPSFMKLDERKKDQIQYFSGDERLKYFTQLMEDNAEKIKLGYDMLCPSTFDANDIDKYNNFSYINDWVSEKLEHGNFDKALVLNRDFKTYLQSKYGTKYFLWSGVVSLRKKKAVAGLLVLSLFVWYVAPFAIYQAVTPSFDTYYYALLFNIETGKAEMFAEHQVKMKDMRCVLNSMVYDTFFRIKTEPKKTEAKKK